MEQPSHFEIGILKDEIELLRLLLGNARREISRYEELRCLQRSRIEQLEDELIQARLAPPPNRQERERDGDGCRHCGRPVNQKGDLYCSRNCLFLAKVKKEGVSHAAIAEPTD